MGKDLGGDCPHEWAIPLLLRSVDWAKYIHKKAAAKLHMRTNVANMLPDFVVIGKGRHHEVARAGDMCADLYKSRWTVEVLFKELKQTLQLQSFYGTNEKAVQWQIWSALIVHLVLRYLAFKSRWCGSYSRFVGLVRTAIWMKTDLETLLVFYGIAPPLKSEITQGKTPYLPGFEKAYLTAVGQHAP